MSMMNREITKLGDEELLARLRKLVARSNETEAELIVHLAEVDERRLYLPRRTSLWDFCLHDLGFSENVANNRIAVARESRRFPRMLEMLAAGRIHLSGLRMLCGQLTPENADVLLDEAAGKTKRELEELLARRAPKPAVPGSIRKLPSAPAQTGALPIEGIAEQGRTAATTTSPLPREHTVRTPSAATRPAIAPLSAEAYKVQFTATPEMRDRIREGQDLYRHQIPSGDLATLFDRALTLLIAQGKRDRFAVGRTPRSAKTKANKTGSRRVPAAIRRAVFERDRGRCAFVDPDGVRCDARGFLTLDHVEGYARTLEHHVDSIRLLCAGHNQRQRPELC